MIDIKISFYRCCCNYENYFECACFFFFDKLLQRLKKNQFSENIIEAVCLKRLNQSFKRGNRDLCFQRLFALSPVEASLA